MTILKFNLEAYAVLLTDIGCNLRWRGSYYHPGLPLHQPMLRLQSPAASIRYRDPPFADRSNNGKGRARAFVHECEWLSVAVYAYLHSKTPPL